MPDYRAYHRSLTDELHALKDRVRCLTQHWPSDGEYKEAALRAVLRRHLPNSLSIGRGFIVTPQDSSTQLDLMIVDGAKPTLFKDGDLMFVTPDCVRAVIEVKTDLADSSHLAECAHNIARVGQLCRNCGTPIPWLGIFSYDGRLKNPELLLDAIELASDETGVAINCMAYGKSRFVRYWPANSPEHGSQDPSDVAPRWRVYNLENLASSYFVGNVVDALSSLDPSSNGFAWFPLAEGKSSHMVAERLVGRRIDSDDFPLMDVDPLFNREQ